MQRSFTAIRPIRFIPALVMMAVIFVASSQPGDQLNLPDIMNYDKAWHMLEYALLAASFFYALPPLPAPSISSAALGVLCLAVLYGISDEFHQSFVPLRDSSAADVVADALGAGIVTGWWWFKARSRT